MIPDLVERIQRTYPKIYLACHVQHIRARSNPARLSPHDGTVLAHLDRTRPITASELAKARAIAGLECLATAAAATIGHFREEC